ncbi:hypothetical protein ACGFNV_16440 [Streptomyces sp. NPDC048751]|uniref:hypothetical protein n=1 Tax=Streptomyces sp. NPDC048751 TaxID=3365591 RepID=UPI00371BEF27
MSSWMDAVSAEPAGFVIGNPATDGVRMGAVVGLAQYVPAPHEVEPFGPAASVLASRDTEHAAHLIARGRGSLAASLVSDDLTLRHGGPGRAGGGSEMGGIHGVLDLMQRTALQASPRVLESLGGNSEAVRPSR